MVKLRKSDKRLTYCVLNKCDKTPYICYAAYIVDENGNENDVGLINHYTKDNCYIASCIDNRDEKVYSMKEELLTDKDSEYYERRKRRGWS